MPKNVRNDQIFRKRYAYFVAAVHCEICFIVGYGAWSFAFKKIPSDYQWILALICPLYRDFNTRAMVKFSHKIRGQAGIQELRIVRLASIYTPKITLQPNKTILSNANLGLR